MIAYYFPPLGMGGVQRMAKLAKYLPDFGWDVTVLTVKPIVYPAYDHSLLEELPAEVEICRAGSHDPARLFRLLHLPSPSLPGQLTSTTRSGWFWPDSKIGWRSHAVRGAKKLFRQDAFDFILSSSPPITGHLVAMELKRQFNIPWVADFRDIWESRLPEKLYSNPKLVAKSHALLAKIGAQADRITAVNDVIGKRISSDAIVISGGYDPDDFSGLPRASSQEKFILCYLGTVGVLHPIVPFFEAIKKAFAEDKRLANDIQLTIIGANNKPELMELARRFELEEKIDVVPYLPHKEALRLVSNAAVMLLSVPEGHDDMITGKIYDYLALPAPVLASAPLEGAAAKFIERFHGGITVPPGEADNLAMALRRLYELWQSGRAWKKNELIGLTRRDAAEQFNAVFESLLHGKNR